MKKIRKRRTKKYIYGRGVTRPYVNKRNRLMLGSGKKIKKIGKQKGGFLPLSFLSTIAPALDIIGKVIGK